VVSCDPNCTDAVSTPLDDTAVAVTTTQGTLSTLSLAVNTGTLSCGTGFSYTTAVSTLSAKNFPTSATLTVHETLANEPTAAGVKVCYAAGTATTGSFLPKCKSSPAKSAPCVASLVESAGSLDATFAVPANDPRFWTGAASVDLKAFSPTKGPPGTTVTITGTNLTEVTHVVIGGAVAPIKPGSSATKLQVTVPANAVTGIITVTADSGTATSTNPFTVT
jgi:hypothetical protein